MMYIELSKSARLTNIISGQESLSMSPQSMDNKFSQIEEESEEELEVILQQCRLANQFLDYYLQQLEDRRKLAEAEIASLRQDIDLVEQTTALLLEENQLMELENERLGQEINSIVSNVELHFINSFQRSE